ncbi:unnamed protein product [Spirodela intermedia]|uniref:Uncharacterized protein n=2 Tax=Spirodela intermedia TaxID=51605 RepID=A0A7I8ING0_SPIIN|nr:unnamed protein product [Spirodela intermedia]CAA6658678.1 unnamed protein product [Spirodela intermedia]CAA7394959.1 unnamed protein product [Spirodela intermedia]
MCPLRIILVFLSATLAGYFAWRSVRSPAPSPFDLPGGEVDVDESTSEKTERFQMGKAIGKGFWVFVDMASGRYLWRNLGAAAAEPAKDS